MIEIYTNTKNEIELIEERLKVIENMEINLKDEKKKLNKFVSKLNQNLKEMDKKLKSLKGIENKIYYEIVVNGLNPTKAVDLASLKYNKDVSTIWKNYYPKVKKEVDKLMSKNIID